MSALLANRVQSAYSRTGHEARESHLQQRPTTSVGTHAPYTNVLNQAALRTLEHSTLNHHRRPKTASTFSSMQRQSATRKLRSDEIESLLKSLDRDESAIVQVDCLANYRMLVQTIDLRKTPVDCQVLCALQQRENRIVQQNACRDTRFRSLIDSLEPSHVSEPVEINRNEDRNHTVVSDYPASEFSY